MSEDSKRLRGGDKEDDVEAAGQWEALNPELLAVIFSRIPAEERWTSLALVCKSWLTAVAGPYCWTDIDIERWCRRTKRSDLVDLAVRKLVRRSKCTFRRLSAYKLGNAGFSFAASRGRCLTILQIPMSEVTDKMVEKHAELLVNLSVLDISNCLKITSKGIEAFGKQCKSLIHLKRNMPPPEWSSPINNTEAMAIAETMTGLCKLELGFGCFGDKGLNAILTACKELTHLDIQGCWSVELRGDLQGKCERITVFKDPWHLDYEDGLLSENDGSGASTSDESSSSDSE